MEHSHRSSQLMIWGFGEYYFLQLDGAINECGGGTRSSAPQNAVEKAVEYISRRNSLRTWPGGRQHLGAGVVMVLPCLGKRVLGSVQNHSVWEYSVKSNEWQYQSKTLMKGPEEPSINAHLLGGIRLFLPFFFRHLQ